MYGVNKVKPVAKDIERLIESKKVVPCWMNKGLFRLVLFKGLAPRHNQSTLGFYTPKTKQRR